jgi:hypothetical protein
VRDLSRPKTDTIRETHGPGDIPSLCRACGQALPCDALILAEEVDLLRTFEQVQRDERRRLEERARRYRNVFQRTADTLFVFHFVAGIVAGSSYGSSVIPAYQFVSNSDEWNVARWLSLGLACSMYGVSRLMLREVPAKRTGIALLVAGMFILAMIVGETLIFNLD